jgi:hypothetical protein
MKEETMNKTKERLQNIKFKEGRVKEDEIATKM